MRARFITEIVRSKNSGIESLGIGNSLLTGNAKKIAEKSVDYNEMKPLDMMVEKWCDISPYLDVKNNIRFVFKDMAEYISFDMSNLLVCSGVLNEVDTSIKIAPSAFNDIRNIINHDVEGKIWRKDVREFFYGKIKNVLEILIKYNSVDKCFSFYIKMHVYNKNPSKSKSNYKKYNWIGYIVQV